MIKAGDHGPVVAALQAELQAHGYYTGGIDAQFGQLTRLAVWSLQSEFRVCDEDGMVGPATRRCLNQMAGGRT
jgi:peptidoglycan hydrolase-like protein with peptidoglycan-binding domain